MIESHGIEKWSAFKSGGRSFPAGFYGVMAYLVDLQNAAAPPVQSDGRAIQDDTGNDPKYPRWAYFKKIDGGESFTINSTFKDKSVTVVVRAYTDDGWQTHEQTIKLK